MKILPIYINPVLDGKPLSIHYGVKIETLHKSVLKDLQKLLKIPLEMLPIEYSTEIPVKQDGYQYSNEEYYSVIKDGSKHHEPDIFNHWNFIDKFHLVQRRLNGEFDEVHIYGGPFMGFHESQMIGTSPIYCNSNPILASCPNFVIMGFNYERGICEALEAFGHRTEFIFRFLYEDTWNVYSKHIGTIHEPFNTSKAYDWGSKQYGMYKGTQRANCELWGCDGYEYIKWWFKHLPSYVLDATSHVERIGNVR